MAERKRGLISGLPVGRVAGVIIEVNWTVLIIGWLLALGLATVELPNTTNGYTTGAYWVAASLSAVLFWVSLLLHEGAHAVVARRAGIGVERIVLWLLGGVSELTTDAPNAPVEARMAAFGPGMSLLLAAIFAGVSAACHIANLQLAAQATEWLARINGILAVFNLLPAFPLDGGRVLRALLWQESGDKLRATKIAATTGRVFGYALIAFGVLIFSAGAGLGGLWFAFIGWFLLVGATGEEQGAIVDARLGNRRVREVMTADPMVVRADMTIDNLIEEKIVANRFSSFPVVDDHDDFEGLITLSEVKHVHAGDRESVHVGDVATKKDDVATCGPDDEMQTILRDMAGIHKRTVVVDHDHVVGIVSSGDITRALQNAEL